MVRRFLRAVGIVIGLAFGAVVLFYNACALWIAFEPVPKAPRFSPAYTVVDAGLLGVNYIDRRSLTAFDRGWSLLESGRVVCLDAERLKAVTAARQSEAARWHDRHPLRPKPGSSEEDVVAVSGEEALLYQDGDFRVQHAEQRIASMDRRVQGYTWSIYDRRFARINRQDTVIGNGRIATAVASSGGASSPHGRIMPLIWRRDWRHTEDLNSRIPADSGWYLFLALDLNERGQILCVARHTDEADAERGIGSDARLVVLTPGR